MRSRRSAEEGNVLICALCTILIISLIGANVLRNCTVRYNVSSSQVRSWKESLFAAEAGGDIAYAEVRKTVLDPPHAFTGWDNSGAKHVSPVTTFGANNLITSTVVDLFYNDPAGNPWYRSRSRGTAPVLGMARTGMDDRQRAVGFLGYRSGGPTIISSPGMFANEKVTAEIAIVGPPDR